MVTNKKGCGIAGVPDLKNDKTFVFLVAGQSRTAPRTVSRFLCGESVGRSEGERESLRVLLERATREAIALRRAEEPMTRTDEALGKALGKAVALVEDRGAPR